jgi:hypothetical protein
MAAMLDEEQGRVIKGLGFRHIYSKTTLVTGYTYETLAGQYYVTIHQETSLGGDGRTHNRTPGVHIEHMLPDSDHRGAVLGSQRLFDLVRRGTVVSLHELVPIIEEAARAYLSRNRAKTKKGAHDDGD